MVSEFIFDFLWTFCIALGLFNAMLVMFLITHLLAEVPW